MKTFLRIAFAAAFSFCLFAGGFSASATAMDMNHEMDMDDMKWDADDDTAFLSAMIIHHRGAVKMAEAVIDTTKDAQVAAWSRAIIDSQKKEIDIMQSLLDARVKQGGATTKAVEEMLQMMEKEMMSMQNMRISNNADVNFVSLMIPHHAGAIDMSLPALIGTSDKRIRELARDIIVAQSQEIDAFRNWLDAVH